MEMVLVSRDELRTLISDSVKACFQDLPQPQIIDNLPEYLSRKEVGEYLGVCLATVDNYSRAGVLTKRYVGNVPRFHRDEVRKVMQDLKK